MKIVKNTCIALAIMAIGVVCAKAACAHTTGYWLSSWGKICGTVGWSNCSYYLYSPTCEGCGMTTDNTECQAFGNYNVTVTYMVYGDCMDVGTYPYSCEGGLVGDVSEKTCKYIQSIIDCQE